MSKTLSLALPMLLGLGMRGVAGQKGAPSPGLPELSGPARMIPEIALPQLARPIPDIAASIQPHLEAIGRGDSSAESVASAAAGVQAALSGERAAPFAAGSLPMGGQGGFGSFLKDWTRSDGIARARAVLGGALSPRSRARDQHGRSFEIVVPAADRDGYLSIRDAAGKTAYRMPLQDDTTVVSLQDEQAGITIKTRFERRLVGSLYRVVLNTLVLSRDAEGVVARLYLKTEDSTGFYPPEVSEIRLSLDSR